MRGIFSDGIASKTAHIAVAAGCLAAAGACHAQQSTSGVDVVVSQRIWAAKWEVGLVDAQAITGAGGAPMVQTGFAIATSDVEAFPVTAFTVHFGDWSLGGSVSPRTSFSHVHAGSAKVARSEYDISLGYSVAPGLSLAIIRKGGKVYEIFTSNAMQLIGLSADQRLSNWLVGVSGSIPISNGWSAYGNAAYGPGKAKSSLGPLGRISVDTRYAIGEAGISYGTELKALSAVKGIDLKIGYRRQVATLRDAVRLSLALPTLETIASTTEKQRSTTSGFIVTVNAVF